MNRIVSVIPVENLCLSGKRMSLFRIGVIY